MFKPDPKQALERLNFNVICLEHELEQANKDGEGVHEKIVQYYKDVSSEEAQSIVTVQNYNDRIEFLKHAIQIANEDHTFLEQRLKEVNEQAEQEQIKFEKELSAFNVKANDIISQLKAKIQISIHQLKGLREFQEHKKQLGEQIQSISGMLVEERRKHSEDLTMIEHRLDDQQSFYDQKLEEGMKEAKKFVTHYSDLHSELLTTKISSDMKQVLTDFRETKNESQKYLWNNDKLRAQKEDLAKKNSILRMSIPLIEKQLKTFQKQAEDYQKKADSQISLHQTNLEIIETQNSEIIERLIEEVKKQRERNISLHKELPYYQSLRTKVEKEFTEIQKEPNSFVTTVSEAAPAALRALGQPYDSNLHPTPFIALISKLEEIKKDYYHQKYLKSKDYSNFIHTETQTESYDPYLLYRVSNPSQTQTYINKLQNVYYTRNYSSNRSAAVIPKAMTLKLRRNQGPKVATPTSSSTRPKANLSMSLKIQSPRREIPQNPKTPNLPTSSSYSESTRARMNKNRQYRFHKEDARPNTDIKSSDIFTNTKLSC